MNRIGTLGVETVRCHDFAKLGCSIPFAVTKGGQPLVAHACMSSSLPRWTKVVLLCMYFLVTVEHDGRAFQLTVVMIGYDFLLMGSSHLSPRFLIGQGPLRSTKGQTLSVSVYSCCSPYLHCSAANNGMSYPDTSRTGHVRPVWIFNGTWCASASHRLSVIAAPQPLFTGY